MTPKDVIKRVNEARPNDLTNAQKMDMISRLDAEAVKDASEYLAQPLIYEFDSDQELCIPFPFDDCYILYCFAQMDLTLADMQMYQNDSAAFNARYQEYQEYMTRNSKKRYEWKGRYYR